MKRNPTQFEQTTEATGSETPSLPKLERKGSKGDVHFHHKNYAQQGSDPLELLEAMDHMRMAYTVLSPIPTNLLVQCGGCSTHAPQSPQLTAQQNEILEKLYNGGVWSPEQWEQFDPAKGSTAIHLVDVPNYYISDINVRQGFKVSKERYDQLQQQDGPLYYNTMVDDQTAYAYSKVAEKDRHRFDPMITGLPLGDMRCSELLLDKLRRLPGVFTGVGEITVYKEWVQEKVDPKLQANLNDRVSPLLKLMHTCGVIGMPVVLHCDVDALPWDRMYDAPKHYESITRFLSNEDCRNTQIIWAHAGGLGRFSRIRDDHLKRVEAVLDDPLLAHVSFDLSWDTVAKQLLMDKDEKSIVDSKVVELVVLLERYPDRFLFGSDALSPNDVDSWSATEKAYKVVFDRLKPQTAEAIKVGNYERLIVGARQKVRLYEKHCVTYAALAFDIRTDNGRPPEVRWAVREAIKDGVECGLKQRAHELDKRNPAPTPQELARLVSVDDLRMVATKTLLPHDAPWEKVPKLRPYLDRAPKL